MHARAPVRARVSFYWPLIRSREASILIGRQIDTGDSEDTVTETEDGMEWNGPEQLERRQVEGSVYNRIRSILDNYNYLIAYFKVFEALKRSN